MRAFDAAERIYDALEEHRGGLTMPMLLLYAGVTPSQYRGAYNWTLDNFGEPLWVKNRVGGQNVYLLPDQARDVEEDWDRVIRTQITRARREYHKAHKFAELHPSIDRRWQELEAKHRLENLRMAKERIDSAQ